MQKANLKKTAILAYMTVSVLFLLFFVYMGLFENVSVQTTRNPGVSRMVEQVSSEEIEDPSAPIGIRREYRCILDDIGTNDTSFAFYLVHHYAEVYFDDELVYSLMPRDTNRIGRSVSSNWVVIPVYPSDNGKEVRVVVTPVFESVRDRKIAFQITPFHDLYLAQLKADMPQLLLSVLCAGMGLVVMFVELILIQRKKTTQWELFFLGNFILLLGIWKLTDTRSSPLLFVGNPMLLGYLTIGALFLADIPFALYLSNRFSQYKPTPALMLSLVASGTAMLTLFCQLVGIAEFKQTLPLAHMVVILLMILTFCMAVFHPTGSSTSGESKRSWFFMLLLICSALGDLLLFYIRKSSSGIVFTLLAILLYTLTLFIHNLLDISKKAYTDLPTGLLNKSRWDTLMDDPTPIREPVSIMMLDLNGLKYVNDTMGHEAGDKILRNFANILRNAIPSPNIICRWGGDEFTVMLTNASREATERYMEAIRSAVAAYNDSGEKPALHYAIGCALSSEFPGLSRKELLEQADARMYLDKQRWYAQHTLS